MTTSKEIAKRYIETDVIAKLAQERNITEKDAMALFYNSTIYRWFADDQHGIAREGVDAILCRVVNELNGDLTVES